MIKSCIFVIFSFYCGVEDFFNKKNHYMFQELEKHMNKFGTESKTI